MNRFVFSDYDSLCKAAAERMHSVVNSNPRAVICLATGASPVGLYKNVVELGREELEKYSKIHVVKLDEWGGLTDSHPSTCESYLRKHFIEPLQVSHDRYTSFKASATDHTAECRRIQAELERLGQIDLCVLGLGTNGHLGLNEPAPYLMAHVHLANLTEQTQQHSMLETSSQKPTFGFTLGMADLMRSKKIFLIVSGEKKVKQLKRLLTPEIDTNFPASFLWMHPDVELFTDIELN